MYSSPKFIQIFEYYVTKNKSSLNLYCLPVMSVVAQQTSLNCSRFGMLLNKAEALYYPKLLLPDPASFHPVLNDSSDLVARVTPNDARDARTVLQELNNPHVQKYSVESLQRM